MFKGFRNSRIYVEGEGIKKTSLLIEGENIKEIGNINDKDLLEIPENLMVIPGLIDEHTHGSSGVDTMDDSIEKLTLMSESILQDGVTTYCPTTMTMGLDYIKRALANVEDYICRFNKTGAKVIGVHLEGPFISKEFKGAQNEGDIIPGDLETFRNLFLICPNIRIATIAYENCTDELIEEMVKCSCRPSIGHSNCTSDKLLEGIEKGITCVTHTYNAQKPLHHRDIGVVGTALLDDRLKCELICDLIHVSVNAVKLLYKNKGKEGIILITDSMEAKHLPDGEYELGGQKVFVVNGAARLENGTLAGSVLTLNKAVYNIKNVLNIPLIDAIDMATINPAKNLEYDDIYGSIKVGKRANFAVVDEEMNVYMTVVEGEVRYKKEGFLCQ